MKIPWMIHLKSHKFTVIHHISSQWIIPVRWQKRSNPLEIIPVLWQKNIKSRAGSGPFFPTFPTPAAPKGNAWGCRILSLLVSEDFAKRTMKAATMGKMPRFYGGLFQGENIWKYGKSRIRCHGQKVDLSDKSCWFNTNGDIMGYITLTYHYFRIPFVG